MTGEGRVPSYRTDADGALDAMRSWLASDPRDWSLDRTDARLWAVLFGWGDGADDEDDAWDEVARRHGWDDDFVAALKARHEALTAPASTPSRDTPSPARDTP